MNEQSGHLSNAQIESYGERTSGAAMDDQPKEEWVEVHLDGCSDCRSRVLNFHRSHFGLLNDSASSTSGSADLQAGRANQGSQTADSNRMTPASGDSHFAGGTRPQGMQSGQEFAGQDSVRPGQRSARPVNTVATPDCPSADELRRLAAGLLDPAQAEKFNRHIAVCNYCGPLLQAYIEDFSDDFSPEEQAVLAGLQSASEDWQKQTARKMLNAAFGTVETVTGQASAAATADTDTAKAGIAKTSTASPHTTEINTPDDEAGQAEPNSIPAGTTDLPNSSANTGRPKPAKSPLFWKWLPIPAAAALTAAICLIVALGSVGIWYARRDTPEKVEQQLARTYTEKRTMDLRWPEAEWGRNQATRGNDANESLRGSLPWSNAMLALSKHPVSDSANQGWLLPRAEAEILEGQVDAAIADLNQALAQGQKSASLMVFLGIAYAQKGDEESLKKALGFFSNADQQQPGSPVVLFNRALIYERLNQADAAIADWNLLLKNEQNSPWANEARTRLKEIESTK